MEVGAWAGSSVSHGLREGVQRSRGRAKVTHRAGGGAGSPASVGLTLSQTVVEHSSLSSTLPAKLLGMASLSSNFSGASSEVLI